LFKNYFYFSSTIKTLVNHFQKTAKELKKDLKKGFVVEIGSNDGEFIKALQKEGFRALGVDPASNIVKPKINAGLPMINDYFSEKLAKELVKKYGQADVIYSFHTLAHIPDMHDIVRGIKLVLKPEGFLAFEVHYLGNLLSEMQYDMIYHEHLYYYSLIALQNFFKNYDMEIYDLKRNDLRAGSISYFVQNVKTGKREITQDVMELRKKEIKRGFNNAKTYKKFDKEIGKTKKDLLFVLNKLKDKNIAGYGASGRGTVIANYVGLNPTRMKFVVDDSLAKQGSYMPGTHNPILSPLELLERKVDYSIVFAWPFINEVIKRNKRYLKNGGKFIIPLPKVKNINGK
jgi:SAM-dependent methyltransferase